MFEYLEVFYNLSRRLSSLGFVSPEVSARLDQRSADQGRRCITRDLRKAKSRGKLNSASWLFSGTVASAEESAMICSLMLTCRACNVEPYGYLGRVLTELPKRPSDADVTEFLTFKMAKLAVAP